MPDMNPLDLALSSQRVGEAVEAIADNAIDPFNARCGQGLYELVGYCFCHFSSPPSRDRRSLCQSIISLSSMIRRVASRCHDLVGSALPKRMVRASGQLKDIAPKQTPVIDAAMIV